MGGTELEDFSGAPSSTDDGDSGMVADEHADLTGPVPATDAEDDPVATLPEADQEKAAEHVAEIAQPPIRGGTSILSILFGTAILAVVGNVNGTIKDRFKAIASSAVKLKRKTRAVTKRLRRKWKKKRTAKDPNGIDLKFWNRPKQINGRRVFQRDDLFDGTTRSAWQDPVTKRWKRGTNKERMADGLAPVGKDNQPVALHHLTQTEPGSLAEISTTLHRKVPHKQLDAGQSFRNDPNLVIQFDAYRSEYWKLRSTDF